MNGSIFQILDINNFIYDNFNVLDASTKEFINSCLIHINTCKKTIKFINKEFIVNIIKTNNNIKLNANKIYIDTISKNLYIDSNLKLAAKHYFLQMFTEIFFNISNNNIFEKKIMNNYFENLLIFKVLTSFFGIKYYNFDEDKLETIKTIFIWNRIILNYVNNQYLSSTNWVIFESFLNNLNHLVNFELLLNYDKIFFKKINENILEISKFLWENKIYFENYLCFDDFFSNFEKVIEFCFIMYCSYTKNNYIHQHYTKSLNIYNFIHNINCIINDKNLDISCDIVATNSINSVFKSIDFTFYDNFFYSVEKNKNYKILKDFDSFKKNNINFLMIINFFKKHEQSKYLQNLENSEAELIFSNIINDCKEKNLYFYLLVINKNINDNLILNFFDKKKLIFWYYLPCYELKNNKNIVLICQKNIINIDNEFFSNEFEIYNNKNIILNFITENIKWDTINYNNHIFLWDLKHQDLVSEYIDSITGGWIYYLPEHWGGY